MGSIFQSCVSDHVLRDDLGNLGTDADGDSGAFVCGCNCRKFCIQHIFQYLKVIVIAISSASAVVIGKDIGEGDIERVKSDGRTLSVIDVLIGIVLASLLFVLRGPLLSMYKLTDTAAVLANHFIMIMSVVMVGMSYQMPVSVGVIQGGGDTRFSMYMNMISTWGIVMPLSFLAAFVWKLPVELVVVAVQSDQLFKGIPVFYGLGAISGFTN